MGNFSAITISTTSDVFQLFSFCYSSHLYLFPIRKGGRAERPVWEEFSPPTRELWPSLAGGQACVVGPLWIVFHCLFFLSCKTHECISLRPLSWELGRAPGRKAHESMASLSPALLTPELACLLSKLSITLTHLGGHYGPSSFYTG